MAHHKDVIVLLIHILFSACLATEKDSYIDIFPPKWYPGDVLGSTDHDKVDNALDHVVRSASLLEVRTVSLGLASTHGKLQLPRSKLKDGNVHSTLPPAIEEGKTGLMLFTKYYIGVSGVYGLVSYEIADSDFMVVAMFSVPFDLIVYNVKFNVKIYPKCVPLTKSLVDHMYYRAGAWRALGYEQRSEYGVNITGTMTDNPHSKLIVWVDSSGLDASRGPSQHFDCAYKTSSLGNRCWRECTPTGQCAPKGWCWTANKCDVKSQCNGDMACDGSCSDT